MDVPPDISAIPTRESWILDLLAKRKAVERALRMRLGEVLGCGYYGCAIRSKAPWVLKLTIDEAEAQVWAHILHLHDSPSHNGVAFGIARPWFICRLLPDVRRGNRRCVLHAIAREECDLIPDPLPDSYMPDDGDLRPTLQALSDYRTLEWDERHVLPAQRMPEAVLHGRLREFTSRMRGPSGGPIGATLAMLLDDGIVMRDLHRCNIGWRIHEKAAGTKAPRCLVLFDPGHSPTLPRYRIPHRNL